MEAGVIFFIKLEYMFKNIELKSLSKSVMIIITDQNYVRTGLSAAK